MAINFPNSPTNGQIFGNYTYDDSIPGWRKTPENSASLPAGTIVQWPGASAPANWLICDGAAVSRTEYASLFAAIGVQYGAGNGTTTFNLPNLKGRVAVGFDSSQSEFDTLGETGGAKTHTLTTSQIPSHTHSFSGTTSTDGSHQHTAARGGTAAQVLTQTAAGDGSVANRWHLADGSSGGVGILGTLAAGSHTHTYSGTTGSNGSGEAHNNLQPYLVLNYIIKTSAGITSGDSELATRVGATESVNNTQNTRLTSLETVTTPVAATSRYTAGGILGTSYTTYVTVTITATGRPVLINMSAVYSNANSSANRTVDFRVQMDGVTLNEELTGLHSPWVSGNQSPLTTADNFLVTPTAGSRTFTLQSRASNVSSIGLFRASLVVTQL
jgi:microcystin-dependent protein